MALLIIPLKKKSATTKTAHSRVGIRVSYVCHCHENFERILLIWLAYASFDVTFDFCFPLLAVTVTGEENLYQLDEVRGDGDKTSHLLKPSSFL